MTHEMSPRDMLDRYVLPFAPLLARFGGESILTDGRAKGFTAVLRRLISKYGSEVETGELLRALLDGRAGENVPNPSAELSVLLQKLKTNLAGLEVDGWRFELIVHPGRHGTCCLRALKDSAADSKIGQLVLLSHAKRNARDAAARGAMLKELNSRNVVAWAIGGPLAIKPRVDTPRILTHLGKSVAELDEDIRSYIEDLSITDQGYNTLLMGAGPLEPPSPGKEMMVTMEPMFQSWRMFLMSPKNRAATEVALRTGTLAALRPLQVALLVRVIHRGAEGFVVVRSNSSLADPGPWTTTCKAELELLSIDDVHQKTFNLERCAGLMLHRHIGLRCHSDNIEWLGAMELPLTGSSADVISGLTAPCLLGVVKNMALNFGDGKDDRPLEFETFKYIFSGRRDRQHLHQQSWPGDFWSMEVARQKALDPSEPLDAPLRLLLTVATMNHEKERLEFR